MSPNNNIFRPKLSGLLLPVTLAVGAVAISCHLAARAADKESPAAQAAAEESPAAQGAEESPAAQAAEESIVAIVNGDVVTQGDVDARAKWFALSTGIPLSADELSRLDAQISQQLIDERLRLQEAQSRKIAIPDADIASEIDDLNKRNPTLPQKLAASGISMRTVIDQLRAQIAWSQVLRQEIGDNAVIKPQQVDARMAIEKAAHGQPEYDVAEIFVPAESASREDAAKRFADTVIQRLRDGAAFANVAAEFSQSEDALSGGDLGWVRPPELDDAVADVVTQMPVGAISNPIKVPGGYAIVTLENKRTAGLEMVTMATIRQAFFPFTSTLVPSAPTAEQVEMLGRARKLSTTAHDCGTVEAANKDAGAVQPSDPAGGEVPLERLSNPDMKRILTSLAVNQPSQPLMSLNGIMVMMVCSKKPENMAEVTREDMANRILDERVERLARKLQRDLERQGNITRYGVAAEESDQT